MIKQARHGWEHENINVILWKWIHNHVCSLSDVDALAALLKRFLRLGASQQQPAQQDEDDLGDEDEEDFEQLGMEGDDESSDSRDESELTPHWPLWIYRGHCTQTLINQTNLKSQEQPTTWKHFLFLSVPE